MKRLICLHLILLSTIYLTYGKKIKVKELKGKIGIELNDYAKNLGKSHLDKINSYLSLGSLKGWGKKKKLIAIQGDYHEIITSYENYEKLKSDASRLDSITSSKIDSIEESILKKIERLNLSLNGLDGLQRILANMIAPQVGDSVRCGCDDPSILWGVGKFLMYGETRESIKVLRKEFLDEKIIIRSQLTDLLRDVRLLDDRSKLILAREEIYRKLSTKEEDMRKEVRSLQSKYLKS